MKKILIFIFLTLCLSAEIFAQTRPAAPVYRGRLASAPPSCNQTEQFYIDSATGLPVYCTAVGTPGTWTAVSAGSSGSVGTGTTNAIPKRGATPTTLQDSNASDDGQTFTINAPTLTGSSATSAVVVNQTWNTSGNPSAVKIVVTDTASGTTSKPFEILGNSAGTTNLFNVSKLGVVTTGAISSNSSITTASSSYFGLGSRSRIYSSTDGSIEFRNNANSTNSNITAANGTFSGDMSGVNAIFSGNLTIGASSYFSYGTNRARSYSLGASSVFFRNNSDTSDATINAGNANFSGSIASVNATASGDVTVTDATKGVVLKAPNATCYRITVSNAGTLATASITCP